MKKNSYFTLKTPKKKYVKTIKTFSPFDKYPLLTYTENNINKPTKILSSTANNSRTSMKIRKDIDPDELYETSIHLKTLINKLQKDLSIAKSEIYKKDIEIKKKNKIIEDCSKDIENDKNDYLKKAKESTLLTLCKEKYNELKKLYQRKCEECDSLKSNMKITKIKEVELESNVLKNELKKIKSLYTNLEKTNESNLKEIEKLKEYKIKFKEQNKIIASYHKNYENLNNNNIGLKNQLNTIYNEIGKTNIMKKRLMNENIKLKLSYKKSLSSKKSKIFDSLSNEDNKKRIQNLSKELNKYKILLKQKNNEIKRLSLLGFQQKEQIKNSNEIFLKPFDFNSIKSVENPSSNTISKEKFNLCVEKSKNLENKVNKYENFLKKNKIDPKMVLYDNFRTSIILSPKNSNKDILQKDLIKKNSFKSFKYNKIEEISDLSLKDDIQYESLKTDIIEENNKNNNNQKNNKKKIYHISNTEENINTNITERKNQHSNNNDENINNNDIKKVNHNLNNDNIKMNNNFNCNIEIEKEENNNIKINDNQNNNDEEFDLNDLLKLIVINLEANDKNKNYMEEKLIETYNEILLNMEDDNIDEEDFLSPFVKMLIKEMDSNPEYDNEILFQLLRELLLQVEKNSEEFISQLKILFDNLNHFSNKNEIEYSNLIKQELIPYKSKLITLLKDSDTNNNYIITYKDLIIIKNELDLKMNEDYFNYLIFLMKKNTPKKLSLICLSYGILELLLNENKNKKENNFKENYDNEEIKIKTNNIEDNKNNAKENYDNEENKIKTNNIEDNKSEENNIEDNKNEENNIENNKNEENNIEFNKSEENNIENNKNEENILENNENEENNIEKNKNEENNIENNKNEENNIEDNKNEENILENNENEENNNIEDNKSDNNKSHENNTSINYNNNIEFINEISNINDNSIFIHPNDNLHLIMGNFKKTLKEKNETISQAMQQFISYLEINENNKIKTITRENFIQILKNNNVSLSDAEESNLYDKFKISVQYNDDDNDLIDAEKFKKEMDKI